MKDDECVAFLKWALPRLHLRWAGFRKVRRQVCRRIGRRIAELELADLAAYRARLEADPAEWVILDTFCRIPISRLYRDRGVFDSLRDHILLALAKHLRAGGEPVLRCWSAGCASGEEVYTLNILWKLAVAPQYRDVALRIIATDVDQRAWQFDRCSAAASTVLQRGEPNRTPVGRALFASAQLNLAPGASLADVRKPLIDIIQTELACGAFTARLIRGELPVC
jgi:hypothetical protein